MPAVKRYMGITMLTLTDDILRELRQRSSTVPDDIKHGVLVWKVIIGSPANMYEKNGIFRFFLNFIYS